MNMECTRCAGLAGAPSLAISRRLRAIPWLVVSGQTSLGARAVCRILRRSRSADWHWKALGRDQWRAAFPAWSLWCATSCGTGSGSRRCPGLERRGRSSEAAVGSARSLQVRPLCGLRHIDKQHHPCARSDASPSHCADSRRPLQQRRACLAPRARGKGATSGVANGSPGRSSRFVCYAELGWLGHMILGHRCLGKRCSNDKVQRHAHASIAVEMERHDAAQDREWWQRVQAGFVSKVLRKKRRNETMCTIVGLWDAERSPASNDGISARELRCCPIETSARHADQCAQSLRTVRFARGNKNRTGDGGRVPARLGEVQRMRARVPDRILAVPTMRCMILLRVHRQGAHPASEPRWEETGPQTEYYGPGEDATRPQEALTLLPERPSSIADGG